MLKTLPILFLFLLFFAGTQKSPWTVPEGTFKITSGDCSDGELTYVDTANGKQLVLGENIVFVVSGKKEIEEKNPETCNYKHVFKITKQKLEHVTIHSNCKTAMTNGKVESTLTVSKDLKLIEYRAIRKDEQGKVTHDNKCTFIKS